MVNKSDPPVVKGAGRELASYAAQLIALNAFAVAQPLFDVLREGSTFFLAHRTTRADIWVLALALGLLAPLALTAVSGLLGLVHRGLRALSFRLFVALYCALFCLQVGRHFGLDGVLLGIVSVAGAMGLAILITRAAVARVFLHVLAPAAFVFVGLFMFNPSVRAVNAKPELVPIESSLSVQTTDVVLLVFDELPLASLLRRGPGDELEIDEGLFPGFARLARESTWFSNATAVASYTREAVPAILTGIEPNDIRVLPTAADHPRNLFRLLANSHASIVFEAVTRISDTTPVRSGLSPTRRVRAVADDVCVLYGHMTLPSQLAEHLPTMDDTWGGFRHRVREVIVAAPDGKRPTFTGGVDPKGNRLALLDRFAAALDADHGQRPAFYFLHSLLPHRTWELLPSGERFPMRRLPGFKEGRWLDERALDLGLKLHLLQLGYVDRRLSDLIERLEANGKWHEALVVLVADHGMSFRVDEHIRQTSPENITDVARVPLFIKLPGQVAAKRSKVPATTLDVVPTVAAVLGCRLPWPVDGVSLFEPFERERRQLRDRKRGMLELPLTEPKPGEWPLLDKKHEALGPEPDLEDLFAFGVRQELVGSRVETAQGSDVAADLRVVIESGNPLLRPGQPTFLVGRILGPGDLPGEVAIALDGVIIATATLAGADEREFAALLHETAAGAEELAVFAIDAGGFVPLAFDKTSQN